MTKKRSFGSWFVILIFLSCLFGSCDSLGEAEKRVDGFLAALDEGDYQKASEFMSDELIKFSIKKTN